MMSNRSNTPGLIDPEEIVNLTLRFASLNRVYATQEVYEAWWKKRKDSEVDRLFALAAIFEAGRIHGLREERQRRAHHTHKTNGGNHHE